MIRRIVLSIVVGIVVALLCILVADVLNSINSTTMHNIGDFLGSYCGLLGVLAGLWYFFFGTRP